MGREASIKVGIHPGMFSSERFCTFEVDGEEVGLLIDHTNLDEEAGLMRVVVHGQDESRALIGLCNGEGLFCGPTRFISALRVIIPIAQLQPPIVPS